MTNTKEKCFAISLLGLPGSGKGTQANFLIEKYNAVSISVGELVRNALKNYPESDIKTRAFEKYNSGQPVDDDFIKMIIADEISKHENRNIIFDNYPFSRDQMVDFKSILNQSKINKYVALNIEIDQKTALKRIQGRVVCPKCDKSFSGLSVGDICPKCNVALINRADDNDETVKNRITEYIPRIQKISKSFKAEGKYIHIDGERTPDEVREEINIKLKQWNN